NQFAFKAYERKLILNPSDYLKMGEVRRKESTKATQICGVPAENLIFLGYPDSGTLHMWRDYWNAKKPFRNFFTRVNFVPYKDNPTYGNAYIPENIQSDIVKILKRVKPSKIFVSHPSDLNPDHRALFNFVQLALLDCKDLYSPEVYCYLVHARRWPSPEGLFPNDLLLPPATFNEKNSWVFFNLSSGQIQNKLLGLDCFKSQLIGRKNWMFSFLRKNEIFQKIPAFVFMKNTKSEFSFEATAQDEIIEEESLKHSKVYNLKLTYDQNNLIFDLMFDKKVIEKEFGVKLYVYGWNQGVPFSLMPKIVVNIALDGAITILNGNRKISTRQAIVNKNNKLYTIKLPYSILENPEFVFVGGETKLGMLTLDFFPWKLIKIY
ncbi:MAG: PIG-L deacetylase family protein, partial [Candidatus Ratteibacteria bacterium]